MREAADSVPLPRSLRERPASDAAALEAQRAREAARLSVAAEAWVKAYQPGPAATPSVTRATKAAVIAWLRTFHPHDLLAPHGCADMLEREQGEGGS